MSSERVNVMKKRALEFLILSKELLSRGLLDLSSFNLHQACQMRIKASILRLTGEFPRIHGIRELMGILARKVEEMGHEDQSKSLVEFARKHRDVLMDIEEAYTRSRYDVAGFTRGSLEEMIGTAEALFKLLDEVEKDVLG